MSLQSVAHLWSIRSWSNSAAGSSISLPWTETPSVNCSGKNHTTCGLAQSLCICSEAIQLQKQKYLDTIVNLFSPSSWRIILGSCKYLVFLSRTIRYITGNIPVQNWPPKYSLPICSRGTSGSTTKRIGLALFSEDWSLSQPGSLSYLSRRVGLEKKERPFGPSSIKDAVPHPTNGLLGLEGI